MIISSSSDGIAANGGVRQPLLRPSVGDRFDQGLHAGRSAYSQGGAAAEDHDAGVSEARHEGRDSGQGR